MNIHFDNSYARDLEGLYAPWQASHAPAPSLVWLNHALALQLGWPLNDLEAPPGLAIFSGNRAPVGARPIAQAYAGHQFGHFSPQLGDGRALLLGEVIDSRGLRQDVAFKGSGPTPFSRGGDGWATLSSVLREAIISEAMHALGVPTTRALAVVETGQTIWRNQAVPAGILTRIASSHIRVGTFEYCAARNDLLALRRLTDYSIHRHDTDAMNDEQPYLTFFLKVLDRQAKLLAQWMGLGFIHGVMNTDNMSISGETIDFGPCAFMEAYEPATVFSSIDTNGRYSYVNQPAAAKWNLSCLASALLPFIDVDTERANAKALEALHTFDIRFAEHSLNIWRTKLGLQRTEVSLATSDHALAQDLLQLMQQHQVDFTQGWRVLAQATLESEQFFSVFADTANSQQWLARWQQRTALETTAPEQRSSAIGQTNPVHIPRNHLVERALSEATEHHNFEPFHMLIHAIKQPYETKGISAEWAMPASATYTAAYRTYCGT